MKKLGLFVCVCLVGFVRKHEAARILAYYPSPSVSHQVVFSPVSIELAKRGHEVVVITTDPVYPNGGGPANLTEINIHDISYSIWKKLILEMKNNFQRDQFTDLTKRMIRLVETQMNSSDVQKILKDKTQIFDLILVEAFVEFTLGLSWYFKAPIIQFSSFSSTLATLKQFGASSHPLIHPTALHEKIYNLTALEKLNELRFEYNFERINIVLKDMINEMMQRVYGKNVPSLEELKDNVDMLFLNVHPIWDNNRPVPPNVIYLGGLHQELKPPKKLPEDLQTYLDSSKNGVIYVSFGSNVDPTLFPPETVQTLVKTFSKLPYDVLWKWNKDELPGRTANIRISKWLPQSDLLRHPKIKLFVTQGGLQSTDEAITAGVPLVGIPIFGDQKFNVEQYIYHGIGVRVEIETITKEKLTNALNTIIRDDSYRKNAAKLRAIITDQPQTPLERAVWWTEYVIRHKGAKHLRSPAANMSMAEYFELELISYILLAIFLALAAIVFVVRFLFKLVFRSNTKLKKN